MNNQLRREKASRRHRAVQSRPLSFGEAPSLKYPQMQHLEQLEHLRSHALDEMQLEHMIDRREREKNCTSCRKDRAEGEPSPRNAARAHQDATDLDVLFSGFLPVGAEMLSVDRYANLTAEGEDMMLRQYAALYPEEDRSSSDDAESPRPGNLSGRRSASMSRPGSRNRTTRHRVTTNFRTFAGQRTGLCLPEARTRATLAASSCQATATTTARRGSLAGMQRPLNEGGETTC